MFGANRMVLRNGLFYFVSLNSSSVIITDANGEFRDHIEFLPLLEADEKQKSGAEMMGFTVDGDGNIFFTVPVLFKVFKLLARSEADVLWPVRIGARAGSASWPASSPTAAAISWWPTSCAAW